MNREVNFISKFIDVIKQNSNGALDGVSDIVILAMAIVSILLVIASIVAFVVSIFLCISYIKYNRTKNSCFKTGEQVARAILDKNGLEHIKVSKNGSILFGNSYSHFFKKVRLRRLIWQKDSITSLAMATQKSSLAVMDKEGDADMKRRIRLTPIIYFGPLAFIPMIIIGVILDIIIFKTETGLFTIGLTVLGLLFYILAFIMSVSLLKTEKKAQQKALELMKVDCLATDEEIDMCAKLFKLYNIEYINNMVIALLELVYRILQIIAYMQNSKNK